MDILVAAVAAVLLGLAFFAWLNRHDARIYAEVWDHVAPPLHSEVEEARATLWDTATQAAAHEAAAERATAEVAELRAQLESERSAAENDRAAAEDRGREAGRQSVADPLGGLEVDRAARQWRDAMGGTVDGSTPASPADALVAALGWELERLREEVGVPAVLESEVPAWLPPSTALVALRLTEEVLAGLVKRSDSLEVRLGTVGVLDGGGEPALTVQVSCAGCPRPLAGVPAVERVVSAAGRLDVDVVVDDLGESTGLVVLTVPLGS